MAKKRFPLLYLASQSARRREILKEMGISLRVIPSHYHERRIKGVSPEQLTLRHALGKVKRARPPKKARFVLGADTLVCYRHHILGKPGTKKEAVEMLSLLSGRSHEVITGVVLHDRRNKRFETHICKTKVLMKRLSKTEILNYLDRIHPFDKAGAYAIQMRPKIVKKIRGSYTNVVGLPKEQVRKMLIRMTKRSRSR